MREVIDAANAGTPVLGICNGFQMLTEAHLLPGGLIRNDVGSFVCRDQRLVVENAATVWTSDFEAGQEITIPLKNGEGGYIASLPLPNKTAPTWPEFYATRRVLPYLKLARDRGAVTDGEAATIESVIGRLQALIPDEPPARLHGDLWNGNCLWGLDGSVHVIDPAAHGGHREAERPVDVALEVDDDGGGQHHGDGEGEVVPVEEAGDASAAICGARVELVSPERQVARPDAAGSDDEKEEGCEQHRQLAARGPLALLPCFGVAAWRV
jgi:hypothetical protein